MTTRRKSLNMLSGGLVVSAVSSLFGAEPTEGATLRMRLPASTSSDKTKSLRLDAFHLVITNHSNERMAVWSDWCSWGWFCPTITIQVGGNTFDFKKTVKNWWANSPDPFYFDPGDHYVLPINLFSDDWIQPKGFTPGVYERAVITASYTIKPDQHTQKLKVWTGTMQIQARLILDARMKDKKPS